MPRRAGAGRKDANAADGAPAEKQSAEAAEPDREAALVRWTGIAWHWNWRRRAHVSTLSKPTVRSGDQLHDQINVGRRAQGRDDTVPTGIARELVRSRRALYGGLTRSVALLSAAPRPVMTNPVRRILDPQADQRYGVALTALGLETCLAAA